MNQLDFKKTRYQYGSVQALDAYLHHNDISPDVRDKYFSGLKTPVRELETLTDEQLYEFADGFMLGIKEHCPIL